MKSQFRYLVPETEDRTRKHGLDRRNILLGGTALTIASTLASAAPTGTAQAQAQQPAAGQADVVQELDTRIGRLDLERGLPTEQTTKKLFDELDFQRAVQAYLWALPIVGIAEWRRAHEQVFGAKDGDIVVFNSVRDKAGLMTPNATTPYIIGFADLSRTGPLVIDYPKGMSAGGVLDFWQRPIADMGMTGPDKGSGAKYLLVGPGQDVAPADGYFLLRSPTVNVGFGYRVLETDPAKATALMSAVRIYPFDQRASPPQNRYLTPDGRSYSQWPPRGMA
jgi:hypothetical protein